MDRAYLRQLEQEKHRNELIPQRRVDGELIISLTSYGERIAKVDKTIATLLAQTYKADRIVLWLAYNEEPTNELRKLVADGKLEIRYCNDIMSFKKLTPSLKEFPDAYIVTADDDSLYKESWLATLMGAYFGARDKYPNDEFIAAHRCHEIAMEGGRTLPYQYWKFLQKNGAVGYYYFQTGAGVLFPPHTLSDEATDENLQMQLSPHCDETFYTCCALKKKTPMVTTGRLMPFKVMHYQRGLWNDFNVREKTPTLARVFSHFGITKVGKFRPSEIPLDLKQKADTLVVLMTTYPPRQDGALKVCQQLQEQTLKPDRIILSLAKSNYPSKASIETLKPFEDLGVEIYWTNDTKTIKQYYPVINELKGNVIISLADDFDYDSNAVRDLYGSFLKYGRQYPVSGSPLRWQFDKSGRLSNYGGASIFLADWCLPYFPQIVEYCLARKKHNGMKLFVDPMMTYAMALAKKNYMPCTRNFYVKQNGGWSSGDTYVDDLMKCHDVIVKKFFDGNSRK